MITLEGSPAKYQENPRPRTLERKSQPDELEMIHGINEQIRLADYDQVVVFYRELMENAMRSDLGEKK